MKKTLLVILLIASVVTGAFAADTEIMLGLQSGFNEQVIFPKTDYDSATTNDYVPIKADAMFYFGDSFALNAALGMDIWLPASDLVDPNVGLVADVLAYYRCELSDAFDILAGGGLSYKLQSYGDDYFSDMRYQTVIDSFSTHIQDDYIETTKQLLKGDYGLVCQYDDPNFETVWSSIFDLKTLMIYRAEGDPRKKKFVVDNRLHSIVKGR